MRPSALVVLLLLFTSPVSGYEVPTHERMARTSEAVSIVDQYLKAELGLDEGIGSSVRGRKLEEWLAYGASREDSFPRFLNHFHNPLATTWSQAGLGGSVGQSSILWAQNVSASGSNWSWQDGRQYFFESLTSLAKASRDTELANTFETLGHQVHLIQDAASPAHARNDPHVLYNYESLVDDVRERAIGTFQGWLSGEPDTVGVPGTSWRLLDGSALGALSDRPARRHRSLLGQQPSRHDRSADRPGRVHQRELLQ